MLQTAPNNRTGQMVEYLTVIRVNLPDPGSFHCSPSGDTEYDEAYKKAIFEAKPSGFEVKWPRTNEKWPVDSEGYTYVPLYLTSAPDAVAHWMEKADEATKELARVKEALRKLC